MYDTQDYQEILDYLKEENITLEWKFIPFSVSRNKDEKYKSFNFEITLLINNLAIITTPYYSGLGQSPSYKDYKRPKDTSFNTADLYRVLDMEAETGKQCYVSSLSGKVRRDRHSKNPIEPSILDVVYSLILDSSALSYSCFEDWAEELGYDTDSRKAEKIYKDCLDIALKIKACIGNARLEKLEELFQDY